MCHVLAPCLDERFCSFLLGAHPHGHVDTPSDACVLQRRGSLQRFGTLVRHVVAVCACLVLLRRRTLRSALSNSKNARVQVTAIYSIVAVNFFSAAAPDNFEDFAIAFFSLFQTMSGDGYRSSCASSIAIRCSASALGEMPFSLESTL